jgi:hypothetical protein
MFRKAMKIRERLLKTNAIVRSRAAEKENIHKMRMFPVRAKIEALFIAGDEPD